MMYDYNFMIAENHFLLARKEFDALKRSHLIPPKMKVKLDYLLATLLEQKSLIEMLSGELPDYEQSSLEGLDKETKLQLFISIVNCLSGRDVILHIKDQKAYIRKDETFSMWTECQLTLDSDELVLRKKNTDSPFHEF